MRDLKYLFTGLALSAVIFCVLLGAFVFISPESLSPAIPLPAFLDTDTPTVTPLLTDTDIPLPSSTSTIEPTQTFTPTLVILDPSFPASVIPSPTVTSTLSPGQILESNGGLVISGPLSPEDQIRLYEASLQFIAPTFGQARRKGEEINGKGYGSPTLICGPLSIAILRAAGLIPEDAVPYDFWQLNPDNQVDRNKLERIFPNDKYQNIRFKIKLNLFDWRSDPLQPGDFLYIYAGTGGNFEHMLVVNRVDNLGRAYSVTNYGTPEGFIINEVLLYDPNDPQAGIFAQWTSRQWAELGSTGFAGFERWRLIPVAPTP